MCEILSSSRSVVVVSCEGRIQRFLCSIQSARCQSWVLNSKWALLCPFFPCQPASCRMRSSLWNCSGERLPLLCANNYSPPGRRSATARQGLHVEAKIGDVPLVLEVGEPLATATRSSIYVYVENVDATYQRALQAGAAPVAEPEDKPYHERGAGVQGTFGNAWWIDYLPGGSH